jgi:hypothetical protein
LEDDYAARQELRTLKQNSESGIIEDPETRLRNSDGRASGAGGLAVLLAVTAVAFAPSLRNDFTNWDDPAYVTEPPRASLEKVGPSDHDITKVRRRDPAATQ